MEFVDFHILICIVCLNNLVKRKIITSTFYKDDNVKNIREFYFNIPNQYNVISALTTDSAGLVQENIVANIDENGKISLISSSFFITHISPTEHKIIIFYI